MLGREKRGTQGHLISSMPVPLLPSGEGINKKFNEAVNHFISEVWGGTGPLHLNIHYFLAKIYICSSILHVYLYKKLEIAV